MTGCVQKIGLLGLMLIMTSAPTAEAQVFRGTSDASAAVALQDSLFVVADDENNVLRVYEVKGRPEPVFSLDMTGFLHTDSGHPEADIEGAARIGERIYWISSHGRNKDGKFRPSRHRFFATAIRRDDRHIRLVPEGKVCTTLARELIDARGLAPLRLERATAMDMAMSKKKRQRLAPKAEGLNIEGLCASADGRTLFVGLRNPRPRGRAVILPLTNAAAIIERGAKPEFSEPLFWDLRDLGVRAMAYARFHRAYLVVAGPHDGKGRFDLYRWTGVRTDLPEPIQRLDATLPGFSPEALVTWEDHPRLWLLSDDGAMRVKVAGQQDCLPGELLPNGTCQNKHLLDPMRKTFRGAWLTLSDK